MTAKNYDIVIIGAGPAGSSAALNGALNGFKVLLLEKEIIGENGRYKACGGALAWELVEYLEMPKEVIEERGRIIDELILHHIDGEIFRKKGKGAVMFRSDFDKFLLDRALKEGIEFLDGVRLISIDLIEDSDDDTKDKGSKYEIITEKGRFRADYIIAADGINSKTLNLLKWPYFMKEDLVMTITKEIQSTPAQIEKVLGNDSIHLFFGIKDFIPLGYAWLFPKKDIITLGWGNAVTKTENYKKMFGKFLNLELVKKAVENNKEIIYRGHLIPVGLRPSLYTNNVFAVGDAGGFVDPISGKGIPYAMLSGKIAIETIKYCIDKAKLEKMEKIYMRKLDKEFLVILKLKKKMRAKIFLNDENLKKFLNLWQKYRSSEILAKKLL